MLKKKLLSMLSENKGLEPDWLYQRRNTFYRILSAQQNKPIADGKLK